MLCSYGFFSVIRFVPSVNFQMCVNHRWRQLSATSKYLVWVNLLFCSSNCTFLTWNEWMKYIVLNNRSYWRKRLSNPCWNDWNLKQHREIKLPSRGSLSHMGVYEHNWVHPSLRLKCTLVEVSYMQLEVKSGLVRSAMEWGLCFLSRPLVYSNVLTSITRLSWKYNFTRTAGLCGVLSQTRETW